MGRACLDQHGNTARRSAAV